MLDRPQEMGALDLAEEPGVVPVRLHRVGGDDGAVQRQRGQQRLEVADLVRLPGLGDLILGDHDARRVGDGGEQVHLLLPAGLRALALLAVHGDRVPGRDVPGIPGHGRVQPRVQRVRPEPAVLPVFPEALRGRRLPLPLLLRLLPQLVPPVRGGRGRDLRVQRRVRQRPGQGGLEGVRVQALRDPVQRPRRWRRPQARRRADPAAVRGQQLLVPARRRLRDCQRALVPARRARCQHRYHRRQLMADPPPVLRISQPARQRPPQHPRLRRPAAAQVAADKADQR
jgi:hypothetical protein